MGRYLLVILCAAGAAVFAVWILLSQASAIRTSLGLDRPAQAAPAPLVVAPQPPPRPEAPRLRVLVATRALMPNHVLENGDIAWANLPAEGLPGERVEAPNRAVTAQAPGDATVAQDTPPSAGPAEDLRRSFVGRRLASYVPPRGVISPRMFDEALLRAVEAEGSDAQAAFGAGPVRYAKAPGDGTAPLAPQPVLVRVAKVIRVVSTESLAGTRWVQVEEVLARAPITQRGGVEGLDLSPEQRATLASAMSRGEIYVVDAGWRADAAPRRICTGSRCLVPEDTLRAPARVPERRPEPAGEPRTEEARNARTAPQGPGRAAGLPDLDRALAGRAQAASATPPRLVPPGSAGR